MVVRRASGLHTVGRVKFARARDGWVEVELVPGASKLVPEGEVYRLLGDLRLA